ncbi:MAG TPA: efflux RND transporter periplasmic adaptor subunit [Fredinandcohnia sp.]|nr:efflux RND transporter periplasmic adaptor subunit [Fredinandcohnia sp.]
MKQLAPLASLLLLAAACSGGGTERARPRGPVSVRTIELRAEAVERVVEVSGPLAGLEEVTVSAEVDGRVAAIAADLGDAVDVGAPLLRLDPSELRLQVARAESEYLESLARLGIDDRELGSFDPATQAEVRRTLADLEEARRNLARGEELFGRNLLAQGEVDALRTRVRIAEAAYQQALESARSAFALAKGRKAALSLAQKKLRDATIVSPIRGVVARRLVALGEYIRAGQPVAVVVMTDPLKLQAEIPERYVGQIAPGMEVEIRTAGSEPHRGTVSRVGPLVSGTSRTFPIEALFERPGKRLRPGVFAAGVVRLGVDEEVFAVPETAISSVAGVTKVFVVEKGVARERSVTLLRKRGSDALVQGGLRDGETLAVTGIARLYDGAPVRVESTEPEARAEERRP